MTAPHSLTVHGLDNKPDSTNRRDRISVPRHNIVQGTESRPNYRSTSLTTATV